jgi:glyoxylate/hydroxypyruvate reductase A
VALLIAVTDRRCDELAASIRARLPGVDVRVRPDRSAREDITFALAWRAPAGIFAELPNLRAVSSLGAGVDDLVGRSDLPGDVALGRIAGPGLAADMAAWLVAVTGAHRQRLDALRAAQQRAQWRPLPSRRPPTVGLLGTGTLGARAAAAFDAIGWPVLGWSRSGRGPSGVAMHRGRDGLARIAAHSDYLVNLLPLTEATRDILDAGLFERMRPESVLVNAGRGEHLVEKDLLAGLARGRPGFAILDVFRDEPLPSDHPFWTHPRIRVTPHSAAVTRTDEAADLAAESYRRVMAGRPPLGAVDRGRGY